MKNNNWLLALLLFLSYTGFTQPGAPSLNFPSNNSTNIKIKFAITWYSVSGATKYHYQVDTTNTFDSKYLIQDTVTQLKDTISYLNTYKKYFWRVRALDATKTGSWSTIYSFTTKLMYVSSTKFPVLVSGRLSVDEMGAKMRLQLDTSPNFNSKYFYESMLIDDGNNTLYPRTPVLLFNQKYYSRLRIEEGTYKSEWGYLNSFTTIGNPIKAISPVNITLNTNFDLKIQVTELFENPKMDTIYFEIEMDTSSKFNSPILHKIYKDNHSFTANSDFLLQNKKYYWRFKVISAIDTLDWSSIYNFNTPERASLLYPNVSSTNNNIDSIGSVIFQMSTGVTYLKFEYDTLYPFSSNPLVRDTITYSSNKSYIRYFAPYYYRKNQYLRFKVFTKTDSSDWRPYVMYFNKTATQLAPAQSAYTYDVNPVFSWYKIGNTKYQVQVDTTSNFNSYRRINFYKDSSALISDDLYYGKTQFWRVRAIHQKDSSNWSAVRYFSTKGYISLDAPNNKSIDVLPSYQLSAFPIRGTDTYEIRLSEDSTFTTYQNFKLGDKPGYIVYTSLSNFKVDYGKTYFWQVIGTHSRDTVYSEIWKFKIKAEEAEPPKVVLVSPTNNYPNLPYTLYDITFDWQDQSNTTSYELQYATSSDFMLNLKTFTATVSEIKLRDFTAGSNYFWRVRGKNLTKTGEWSDVWTFGMIEALTVPFQTTPDNKTNLALNMTLNWEDIAAASSYDYRYGNTITLTSAPIYNTLISEAKLSNLTPNKNYYWEVRSRNQYYVTGWSFTSIFTTGTSLGVENRPQIKYIVYPNPVYNNQFNIQGINLTDAKIELFDLKGIRVELIQNTLSNANVKLETQETLHGLYLLKIQNSETTNHIRVMFK